MISKFIIKLIRSYIFREANKNLCSLQLPPKRSKTVSTTPLLPNIIGLSPEPHASNPSTPSMHPPYLSCNSFSYDKKSTLSKRKTSIGYGTRSTVFDGKRETIAPSRYNTISAFENKKLRRGYSFSHGREEVIFGDYHKVRERTPSPSAYESGVRKSKAYSIRSKKPYPKNCILHII